MSQVFEMKDLGELHYYWVWKSRGILNKLFCHIVSMSRAYWKSSEWISVGVHALRLAMLVYMHLD